MNVRHTQPGEAWVALTLRIDPERRTATWIETYYDKDGVFVRREERPASPDEVTWKRERGGW